MYSKEKVIKKVYKLFENSTPLATDCGELCGHCCCHGDEFTGMWLVPGEELFFDDNNKYKIKKNTENENITLLVCDGNCDRNIRPFACRIFPLFPLCFEGKIYVIDDPMAVCCPLCNGGEKISKKFIKNVEKAGKLLLKNEETKKHIEFVSSVIIEILETKNKIIG